MVTLHNDDCINVLKKMDDNSVTAIVTDPPYGLGKEPDIAEIMGHWAKGEYISPKGGGGFMGKSWDSFVPSPAIWKEVYRVLKPGGTALVFAGTRTQDLMSISLRFAGFKIKDTIMYLFGSGFPKSHNIGKKIDSMLGKEREIISQGKPVKRIIPGSDQNKTGSWIKDNGREYTPQTTIPASEEANLWNGYGSCGLKPSYEPIIVCMKPNDGTNANNALTHGVAGINIDETRVLHKEDTSREVYQTQSWKNTSSKGVGSITEDWKKGRWPANIILDEEAGEMLDEQTGTLRDRGNISSEKTGGGMYGHNEFIRENPIQSDSGGASRFFQKCETKIKEPYVYSDREYDNKDTSMFNGDKPQAPSNYNDDNGKPSRFFYTAKCNTKERSIGLDEIIIFQYEFPKVSNKKEELCQNVSMDLVQSLKKDILDPTTYWNIERSGRKITVLCLQDSLFTILTKINKIIDSKILSLLIPSPIQDFMEDVNYKITNGGNLVENVDNSKKLKPITIDERTELVHGVRIAVSKMLSKIKEKENWQNFKNIHSTVKPISLIFYLCKLIKMPEQTIVLDPFMGSGTTGIACELLGLDFIGIEKDTEEGYFQIAEARIDNFEKYRYIVEGKKPKKESIKRRPKKPEIKRRPKKSTITQMKDYRNKNAD